MATALEVRGLWKCYAAGVRGCSARIWVLRGVTFAVACGERLGVIGARGAGKTTLLRCLRGLLRSDAGVIEVAPAATSELLFLDEGECIGDAGGEWARTMIVTARDTDQLRVPVDRCLVLRDGKVIPFHLPARARRVAERGMRGY
jgi:ABC-type transporter Mla maintaining outer membrane lipid asymmetry ATPase subunit MlaF